MSIGESVGSASALVDAPWFRATVLGQLSLYLIPSITAWTSTLSGTALIPLVALPLTLWLGVILLISKQWRGAGGRIIAGTIVAAALELALTFLLVIAYSSANPGWDLS